MVSEQKTSRLATANRAIEVIASYGRKFFSLCAEGRTVEPNRISHFQLRDDGRLFFLDKYTQKPIYVAYRRGGWRGFSEGGTLRNLVCAMADWITGKREAFPLELLGPWPTWVCGNGDLWGYGADMERVREEIKQLVQKEATK